MSQANDMSSHSEPALPLAAEQPSPAERLSPELSADLAELFRALADPTRASIVYSLVHEDMTTSGLAALLEMNPPTISQHLRLLRALRIVKPRREGQLVYYSLDDDHIRLLVTMSLHHLRERQGAGGAEVG